MTKWILGCLTVFAAGAVLGLAGNAPLINVRPGVWAADDPSTLPLPVAGHQVFLIGEMHGVQENVAALEAYLKLLAVSGLRDVAIEEDSVYQRAAQDYVTGKTNRLPSQLCLRASTLDLIRSFNARRPAGDPIRVHLVDIDSPAAAIHRHFAIVRSEMPASPSPSIPAETEIKQHGLAAVHAFRRALPPQHPLLIDLRTIEYSIHAYIDGLEVGEGQFKGSPYLESREQAIADNVKAILAAPGVKGLLIQYGSDHISKVERKDGGPKRDQPFAPMALRLERAGVKVFSLLTVPLSGASQWRGRKEDMYWNPSEARLSTGESFDQVIAAAGRRKFLFVDPSLERMKLPSQDLNRALVDAYLLFASGAPMRDQCAAPKR